MRVFLVFFILVANFVEGQNILIVGNYEPLCLPIHGDSTNSFSDSLNLLNYEGVFIFSTANSTFSDSDISRIKAYLEQGGSIYIGADNWPLNSELDQISDHLYKKRSFGNYEVVNASSENTHGNLRLNELDTLPAGKSTRAFPLDPRLKVEAWVNDEPLIQSGFVGKGRIVIDGGYSRYYCQHANEKSDLIFERILEFLIFR